LHIYTQGGGGVRGNNTPVSFTRHRHRHQRQKRLYSRAPAALMVVVAVAAVSQPGGGDICTHKLVKSPAGL